MLTNDTTNEFQLLVASSWAPPEALRSTQVQRIEEVCRRGIAWDSYLGLVRRHQVPALAYQALELGNGWTVPSPALEELRRLAAKARTKSLLAAAECARIARAFSSERIGVLPLKGAPLSMALYGDPAARHSTDVDIQVPEGEVERAESVLESLGYQPEFPRDRMTTRMRGMLLRHSHASAYRNPCRQMAVDLHWGQELWTRGQVDELWRRSETVHCLGAPMQRLNGDILLLYLSDHGAKHNWSRAKWLSDVAMLLVRRRMEPWEELFTLARRLDAVASLATAAFLVRSLYGIALAPELNEFVVRERRVPAIAEDAIVAMGMTQEELLAATRDQWVLRKLRNQRLRRPALPLAEHLLKQLIHAEDLSRFVLPDSMIWMYYPLRPFFRLWRKFRPFSPSS